MAPDADDDSLIDCSEHGKVACAIVCKHHIESSVPVGFVDNSPDPTDRQAWCLACEERFQKEGELNAAFREFNDFKVVCIRCYEQLQRRHTAARA